MIPVPSVANFQALVAARDAVLGVALAIMRPLGYVHQDLLNRSLNDASETLLDLIQLDPAELVPFSGLMFDGCVYFPVNGGFEHDKIGPAKALPVEYTSSDARDERLGIRRRGRYIDDGVDDGPEPGQNTIAFCSVVAAEEMRMLVRYLVGQDWWHDFGATSGQWSFEHRFVEAETEWLEHPDRCVDSCEFARKRVGRGAGGRPTYPFLDEVQEGWRDRFRLSCRRVRATVGRLAGALPT